MLRNYQKKKESYNARVDDNDEDEDGRGGDDGDGDAASCASWVVILAIFAVRRTTSPPPTKPQEPFKENEFEQSTEVAIMYPVEPPVVCEFDWELDELEAQMLILLYSLDDALLAAI
ncbi:hypothetical protein NL676_018356 [Syzygium grande]|nr:hypothetical protein NL676_018356 [Syzygium grande]